MKRNEKRLACEAALVACAATAVLGIRAARMPDLSADEAVFGLMARAIGAGEDFPVFCWGAHYAGALVSYVAAGFFRLGGESVFALRAAMIPWGAMLSAFSYAWIAPRWGRASALVAASAAICAPPLFATYQLLPIGGYGESFFLSAVILLWAVGWNAGDPVGRKGLFLWGLLAGLAFWILWLAIPPTLAAAVLIGRRLFRESVSFRRRGAAAVVAGFVLGALPFFGYNLANAGATFLRLGARSLDANRAELRERDVAAVVLEKLTGAPEWLCGAVDAAQGLFAWNEPWFWGVGAFAVLATLPAGTKERRSARGALALASAAFLLFAYAGGLNRPRHFALLWPAVVLAFLRFPGSSFVPRWLGTVAAGLLVLSYAPGLFPQAAPPQFPRIARAIRETGARAVYTDYNLAYPLAFAAPELSTSPALGPNKTERTPWRTARAAADSPVALLFSPGAPEPVRIGACLVRRGVPIEIHPDPLLGVRLLTASARGRDVLPCIP